MWDIISLLYRITSRENFTIGILDYVVDEISTQDLACSSIDIWGNCDEGWHFHYAIADHLVED